MSFANVTSPLVKPAGANHGKVAASVLAIIAPAKPENGAQT